MSATPVIRKAVRDDAPVIAEHNRTMAVETENKVLDEETVRRGVLAVFDGPDKAWYLLATIGNKIAGQLMITSEWSDWRNGWFWWIQSVYVRPEHRRSGVFQALYQHVRKLASEDSTVCGIRLYVESSNEAARRVYRRLGMVETDYRLLEEDWAECTPQAPSAESGSTD